MKKIFTLCLGLFAGLAVQAQNDFPLQFVDKDGQIISDGSVVIITDYEEDELFGDILMPTNVWVKNISNETVQGGASYTIQKIDNGSFQTCFPTNCMRQMFAGTYSTGTDAFMPGQLRDMQTEWFPEGEGVCEVTYQLKTFRKVGTSYFPDEDGPTITLNYYYGTTGIGDLKGGKKICSVTYYDLSGQITDNPRHGVYLKRTAYADGTYSVQKTCIVNKTNH